MGALPLVTASVLSENSAENRLLTVAPEGAEVSSSTAARVAAPVKLGASLTAPTAIDAVSVAVENAVMPPFLPVPVSAVLPAVPLDLSQARKVMVAEPL